MSDPQDQPTENPAMTFRTAAGFALELGYAIAVPLVVFGAAGRYLDGRFGSAPMLFLAGILLALAASVVWLARKIRRMAAEIDRIGKEAQEKGRTTAA
jgi:F0F1-type ATP synthase assembly protein I